MATKYHKPVARAASLAAALALTIPLAPLAASAAKSPKAAAVSGTVVETNLARHTLVIATGGAVDTVRFSNARAIANVALGSRVMVRASRLADGTFKERSMRAWGHARHTTIHGAVVSSTATQLVLSTGTSTLLINSASAGATVTKSGRHSHVSGSTLGVGAEVRVGLDIQPTGLDATSITDLGQSGFIGLDGTLGTIVPSVAATSTAPASSGASGSLVISVEYGANITVVIPPSISLPPTIKSGDTVELLTAYAAGSFTLVTIIDDTIAANQVTNGASIDQSNANTIEAEGQVSSYVAPNSNSTTSPGSLLIQSGDGMASMNFAVTPSTIVTGGPLQAGARVDVIATESSAPVSGSTTPATLTALSIHVQQPEGEGNGLMTTETEGLVSGTPTSTSLTVLSSDGALTNFVLTPSTIVTGGTLQDLVSGARVHVKAIESSASGTATLTAVSIHLQQPEGDQGNQNNQNTVIGTTNLDGTFNGYTPGATGSSGVLMILTNDGKNSVSITVPSTYPNAISFTNGQSVTATVTSQNTVLTLVNIVANS